MSVEISRGVCSADLWQPGAPRVEPPHGSVRRGRFPFPAQGRALPHVGGVLRPAARLGTGSGNPCLPSRQNVPLGPGIATRLADAIPNPSHTPKY